MSEVGFFITGCFVGMGLIFFIRSLMSGDSEKVKARNIIIQYKDGTEEKCLGTEWSNYDEMISIHNNELEDNLVKEINLDSVKSIGFVKEGVDAE